ncbi:uncharacterized protein LOC121643932 [Scomber scombrus]|uniref:Uncharacterized protein LOC121643932 n=1 Tax=Scomber scombrus TaxID=13677 RepID=A0AAV1QBF7_SCOSC
MKPNEQGKKRKEKEPPVHKEGMIFGVPIHIHKTPASSSATTASTAATSANSDHDYTHSEIHACDQDADLIPLPVSAPDALVKPKDKKQKAEISLADLQNNIVAAINEQADNLEGMITRNAVSIEALKKSIDFAFAEVESLKTDMREVKTASERHDQLITELQLKLNETERYGRRWNLRLHGVPEGNPEDIKAKVINICCAMVPGSQQKIKDDIDIVHRLGRYQGTCTRPRTTIIRFTNRSTRDLLWRTAKNSEYLKNNKLRFAEDLTADDKAIRNKLWTMTEAEKKEERRHILQVPVSSSMERRYVQSRLIDPKWSHHTLVRLPTLKIPCDFLQDDQLKVY